MNGRSVATMVGGILLVVLLAPRPAWIFLVITLAMIVGAVAYRRELRQKLASFRPRPWRSSLWNLVDLLDGLEVVAAGALGTAVFVGVNFFVWQSVEKQDSPGLVFLYFVLVGMAILSVIRDVARLRIGLVTAVLGTAWLCCVLWVAYIWAAG
ncbi:MAG TPA: hypothetical protein VLK65_20095 [Vicinamibacteria bacterium]|nr:hypothetical protein [Vicinamibacteria bacterium]